MNLLFMFFALLYSLLIIYFFIGIYRVKKNYKINRFTVTVLVPARNEENGIIQCLDSLWKQSYPRELFKVIIIDDHSIDKTYDVVNQFIQDKPNFLLLKHEKIGTHPTYKKQALKFAMEKVSSEIIMTIDADTIANPMWIESMVDQYDDETGLVAGIVTFSSSLEKSMFYKMQTLEFAGIVFCGLGSLGNNNPIICNGSNLSYRFKSFKEAGGYDGNLFLPSGDDDLLLQNIHKKTNWQVRYSIRPETINYTHPVESFKKFINQRARWASKSLHYPKKWLFLLMLSLYVFYLMILVGIPLVFLGILSYKIYILGLVLKLIPEALIISKSLEVIRRKDLLKYFLLTEFFHVFYVLIVGLLGFLQKYDWNNK